MNVGEKKYVKTNLARLDLTKCQLTSTKWAKDDVHASAGEHRCEQSRAGQLVLHMGNGA